MAGPALVRLTVTVPADQRELALAEACALLGSGCREDQDGERATLDFWLVEASADPAGLRSALRGRGLDAEVAAAPEDDSWRDAARAFHRPVEVAGRLLVRTPWEAPRPPLLDVEIDPGMAFGTGQHATTRGCLELLCAIPAGRRSLLDAGCGSGVLALAARRLGFDPVWAVDSDPLAVEAALANARRNRLSLRVSRRRIGAEALPAAEVLVANLTATLLDELAAGLPEPGPRTAILSGLRPAEAAAAAAAFAPAGLEPVVRLDSDGWSTLLLGRGPSC